MNECKIISSLPSVHHHLTRGNTGLTLYILIQKYPGLPKMIPFEVELGNYHHREIQRLERKAPICPNNQPFFKIKEIRNTAT
jgi:hypothetical protein